MTMILIARYNEHGGEEDQVVDLVIPWCKIDEMQ